MGVKFANSAYATLASSINSSATSITLTTGQGARFPSLSGGDYFYATLIDTSNNLEIVKCTARSSDVLTVVRGQEGTTARAYSTSDRIELRITAQGLVDAAPVQSVAGKTGTVVLEAADIASGVMATARLASSGTASSSTFLRGDQSWQTVAQTLRKVHYFSNSTRVTFGGGTTGSPFNFTSSFTPLDSANNSFIVVANVPGWHAGQNVNGAGIRFAGNSSGVYDYRELGILYQGPGSYQALNAFMFNISAGALPQQSYTVQHYVYSNDSNMARYNINSSDDGRLSQTVSTMVIYEYRN
jgi:hypothetical protein